MGFDSFLGNPAAVAAIREMLRADRLPGALLFTGPVGVGKKTLALLTAKASVCERLPDDACGECASCRRADEMIVAAAEDLARRRDLKESARRVEGLLYFDLQLVAPIGRYVLSEQIRVLRQAAYTRPFELRRRFFVIDEAQAIHWQAADLLLKVMEEPPDTTTFILVCPNAGELRATLRSRCQQIGFSAVDEDLIARVLEERTGIPAAKLPLAVRLADGSVGKALALDLNASLERRQPWLQFLESLSAAFPGASSGAAGAPRPAAPDWQRLFESTRALTGNREGFEESLNVGYGLLRDLLLVLEQGERAAVRHVDLRPRLMTWSARLGFPGIESLKDGLDEAYRLQVRNVNQQLGFDALAAGMLSGRLPRG